MSSPEEDQKTLASVDFAPFMLDEGCVVGDAPTPTQLACAAEINTVCLENGFLYLKNFGVTDQDVEEAFAKSKQLFALSDDAKAAVKPYSPATNTGLSKMATEALNTARPPDLKEAFNVRSSDHFDNDYAGTPEGQGTCEAKGGFVRVSWLLVVNFWFFCLFVFFFLFFGCFCPSPPARVGQKERESRVTEGEKETCACLCDVTPTAPYRQVQRDGGGGRPLTSTHVPHLANEAPQLDTVNE